MDGLPASPSTWHSPPQARVQGPGVRPYPAQYVGEWTLPDGAPVTIRPIRPEDEPLMRDFHERLSDQTVYLRYFHMIQLSQRVAHEPLSHLCFTDFDREMVLVVEGKDATSGRRVILAVARLSRTRTIGEGELDLLVDDAYQRHGLGTELLRRLIVIGRGEKGFVELLRLCCVTTTACSGSVSSSVSSSRTSSKTRTY